MPTYQYACTECGHRFEAVQAFSETSLSECPECAGRLRKVYGSVGVVFKGSGFYRTDSRSGSSDSSPTSTESGSGDKVAASTSNGSAEKSTTSDKKAEKKDTPAKTSTSSAGSSSGTAAAAS